MARRGALTVLVLALLALPAIQGAALASTTRLRGLPLTPLTDVPLPGNPTRFDYQAVDPTRRRLYIAHLGDSALDVLDLDNFHVVATVRNIATVHGVAVAPDIGRVYATATGANQLVAIDEDTNKVIFRTPTGNFPDGVAYDSTDRLVFTSNKNDGTLTVVDAITGTAQDTLRLSDEVGNVVYDAATRRIYAAALPPNELILVNPTTRQQRPTPLSNCHGAHGVYVDSQRARAFVACENNARLVTVDLSTQKQRPITSVGDTPDVLAFDPRRQQLYVASESGVVSAFSIKSNGTRKVGEQHVAPAAHSIAVDPTTGNVFLPLQNVGGRAILRVLRPTAS